MTSVEQKRVSRQAREIKDLMTLTAVVVITVLTLLMAVVEREEVPRGDTKTAKERREKGVMRPHRKSMVVRR